MGKTSPVSAQADASRGTDAASADGGTADAARADATNSAASRDVGLLIEESAGLRGAQATRETVHGVLAGGAVELLLDRELRRDVIPTIMLYESGADPAIMTSSPTTCGIVHPRGAARGATNLCIASVETITGSNEVVSGKCPTDDPAGCLTRVVASIPRNMPEGYYQVQVILGKHHGVLPRPQRLRVVSQWGVLAWSALPIAFGALLVLALLRQQRRTNGCASPSAWGAVFIDPASRSYSLSRAQFVLWSSAISTAYVFLFVAGGIVDSHWQFPSMEGFGLTFLISLGTLVGAEATTYAKGSQGAGAAQPGWSDLIVHGGVLALERVQQLLWTLIAVGMFLLVVYKDYAESRAVPTVPNELLILMGVSSVGYLGGKLARGAGPIIDKVELESSGSDPDQSVIRVSGRRLAKSGVMLLDGNPCTELVVVEAELPEDGRVPNPDLARTLRALIGIDASSFRAKRHTVRMTNLDGQHAEWVTKPSIEAATVDEQVETYSLHVEGPHLSEVKIWSVTGASLANDASPQLQPNGDWRIPIKLASDLRSAKGWVTGTAPDGQQVKHEWSWVRAATVTQGSPTK